MISLILFVLSVGFDDLILIRLRYKRFFIIIEKVYFGIHSNIGSHISKSQIDLISAGIEHIVRCQVLRDWPNLITECRNVRDDPVELTILLHREKTLQAQQVVQHDSVRCMLFVVLIKVERLESGS